MQKLVVLGGGESGYGTAVLAKKKGWVTFLSDAGSIAPKYKQKLEQAGIEFEEKGHSESKILDADVVVKSPGIPDTVSIITKLRQNKTPVISEIEFAGRYTDAKTICITGSNGKTTTTALIYQILCEAGYNVGLGGNIGDSFAYQVATHNFDWYVIELSSFQLDGMFDFKADIGVLMNITPDHLDRYDNDMQKYIDSKMRITQNQGDNDYFIFCNEDENSMKQLPRLTSAVKQLSFGVSGDMKEGVGAKVVDGEIWANIGKQEFKFPIDKLKIKGTHNLYNAMAAILSAMSAGVDNEAIASTLAEFKGVEHRLEFVANVNGVTFINDSKATNIDATWYALDAMEKPVVWIVGGTDKGNDYSQLHKLAKKKVKGLIAMGVDNNKILNSFKEITPTICDTHSIDEALTAATSLAKEGDVVLLSPACASFDLFNNYEHRGELFKNWVKKYKQTVE